MAASRFQGERKHKLPGKSSLHLEPGGFAVASILELCPAPLRQAKVFTRLWMTRGPLLQSSSWRPFSAPIREEHAISELRGAHCQKCRLERQHFQGQGADQGGRHTMKVTMTKFINGLDSGNLQHGRLQQSQQLSLSEQKELCSVSGCFHWALRSSTSTAPLKPMSRAVKAKDHKK